MRIYQLHSIQLLPIPALEAWDFLSDPENIKTITPEHMGFTILHPINKPMYPGQIIQYSVSPFPFFKTRWVTEITHVKAGEYFVDEQRFGPYKLWHHKHFIQVVKGGVSMEDIMDFKLPFGIFGRIAYELLVRKQLYSIFKFREQKLAQLFGILEHAPQKLTFRTRLCHEKNILMTVGSHGIGLELVKLLTPANNVYIASRAPGGSEGTYAMHTPFDALTDQLEPEELPEMLHGFVYCPGSINLKPFIMMGTETFEQDMQVNFFSLVRVVKHFLPRMAEGSAMVFFSTIAVRHGMPFHTSIVAAKGAIKGFSRAFAAEYAPCDKGQCYRAIPDRHPAS